MLRTLIARYLDRITDEREFDSPFIATLAAEGFSEVHFLHGITEFGKDFVAKKAAESRLYQWMFQSKAGDIGAAEWRVVKGQLLEAITSTLGHPNIDPSLPRNVVLVLTGRLRGTAQIDFGDFRQYVRTTFPDRDLGLWDRETLVDLLEKHGPEQIYSAENIGAYGSFLRLYGDILSRSAVVSDIEQHYAIRLATGETPEKRIAITAIEASILVDAAKQSGEPYLALYCLLGILRAALYEMQEGASLYSLLAEASVSIGAQAWTAANAYLALQGAPGGMAAAMTGGGAFVTYPVTCARLIESLALAYAFGVGDAAIGAAEKLQEIVSSEGGAAHSLSDRYAVGIVSAIRVLKETGKDTTAREFLKRCAIWLIDRYWADGDGIASTSATEAEEVRQLLGGPFAAIEVKRTAASFLACALMDSACFLQDADLFLGLRHDIIGAGIAPNYYQVQDTRGQFVFDAADVVRMPNIEFAATLLPFEEFRYGEHLDGEPRAFLLQPSVPNGVYLAVSLLLRDRYFPTTWTHPVRQAPSNS